MTEGSPGLPTRPPASPSWAGPRNRNVWAEAGSDHRMDKAKTRLTKARSLANSQTILSDEGDDERENPRNVTQGSLCSPQFKRLESELLAERRSRESGSPGRAHRAEDRQAAEGSGL
jgi:hypothetical protein